MLPRKPQKSSGKKEKTKVEVPEQPNEIDILFTPKESDIFYARFKNAEEYLTNIYLEYTKGRVEHKEFKKQQREVHRLYKKYLKLKEKGL